MKANAGSGTKGKGIFRIIEFTNPSGGIAYRLTGWTMDGLRVRKNYKTHGEAVAEKQALEVEAANLSTAGQTVFTRLTPEQVSDAEQGRAMLKQFGHENVSFVALADFFHRNYRDPLKRISTSKAIDLFVTEKKSANRRRRYVKDLEQELGYLNKDHSEKPIHELQKDDLAKVIASSDRGPERQNNIRKDYRTFFNWCLAHGYVQSNPAELIPVKTVERGEIAVLPVKTIRAILDTAAKYKKGKLVPYISLAAFCAIRPDELARLSWDQIDLKEKQVTVTASAAKKRGRRVVDISENCIAWLSPFAKDKPPIKGVNWRKDFDWIKARIGFGNPERMPQGRGGKDKEKWAHLKPWPQDVLRHTGISCHYRLHGDEAKTASWAGNSPDMIHAHYRALISATEAKALFEIVPGAKGGAVKAKAPKAGKKIVNIEDITPTADAAAIASD
jgi:integrase